MSDIQICLKQPHPKQAAFIYSNAKRVVLRAGRRSGKTTGIAVRAVLKFLEGRRVLYAAPTATQLGKFWWEITTALEPALMAGYFHKKETDHTVVPLMAKGSEARIRAKTAWNADTLRGDFADELILDEFQQMDPDAWALVGAPMLLDNDGNATFIYTAEQRAAHARELYKRAEELMNKALAKGEQPRWEVFNFSSYDNPYLSQVALDEIVEDMNNLNYRLEIMAEDLDDDPRALWNRDLLQKTRVLQHPELARIVVGVDPAGGMVGTTGIIVAGSAEVGDELHAYVLEDASIQGDPHTWAGQVVSAYHKYEADRIVAERNFGGDMVENTILGADKRVPVKIVTASRGKQARAEPVQNLYAKGRIHHVGTFPELEDEMAMWYPTKAKNQPSPNRLDAAVWALSELLLDYCATELGSIELPMW